MRSPTPSSFTSLLSALFVVVALMLAGCSADSLTGPVLDPETTIQANGDDGHNAIGDDGHNAVGDDGHNKIGDDGHNKIGDDGHN